VASPSIASLLLKESILHDLFAHYFVLDLPKLVAWSASRLANPLYCLQREPERIAASVLEFDHKGIPVWERYPSPDGMFSRSDFTYDAERDVYICANGRLLRTSGTVHDGRVRNYLSQPQDCRACTLKQRCTRAPFKKIARDINEDARNHARSLKGTPEFERSSNARKKVEMRFAHLKVQHGFERMRLRGLTGARDEFHLAAIVQNLKTMALRLLGPPTDGVCGSIA